MKRMVIGSSLAMALFLTWAGSVEAADAKAPGPLGLPSIETLQKHLSLTEAQTKKCEAIYEAYKEKAREVEKKDEAARTPIRDEIVTRLKEQLNADQQKMLDHLVRK